MKYYDYTYLTRQDMSEEDAKKLQDKLAASITAKQGVIADLPKAYKKRLAYRIKKQENAYVNTILFQAETQAIEEFKKEADGIAEILRGLVIVYDPEKLKREARPEISGKAAETEPAAIKAETPAAASEPEKKEKVKEEEEKKEEAPAKEKKEVKEEKEEEKPVKTEEKKGEAVEESKEEKPKPKRRTKIKTELKDIEQKLDEILK